jgi:hypothetical protein
VGPAGDAGATLRHEPGSLDHSGTSGTARSHWPRPKGRGRPGVRPNQGEIARSPGANPAAAPVAPPRCRKRDHLARRSPDRSIVPDLRARHAGAARDRRDAGPP